VAVGFLSGDFRMDHASARLQFAVHCFLLPFLLPEQIFASRKTLHMLGKIPHCTKFLFSLFSHIAMLAIISGSTALKL
jgi:hypothetical protein